MPLLIFSINYELIASPRTAVYVERRSGGIPGIRGDLKEKVVSVC